MNDLLRAQHVALGKKIKYSYIIAFSTIVLVLAITLIINQAALYAATLSRQAATVESSQTIRSQRINRDSILLLTQTDHTAIVKEMRNDLASLEQTRKLFASQYAPRYPALKTIDHGQGLTIYLQVYQAASQLVALEQRHLSDKARRTQEYPYILLIFQKEPEQLNNIQSALSIIDADTDARIANTQHVDIASSILSGLIVMFELLFVLIPTVRYFSAVAILPDEEEKKQHDSITKLP